MTEAASLDSIKAEAPRRLIVLGASNVTRGISTIVQTARHQFGAPLDLLIAAGHGRSYGLETTVLGRTLPAILTCGIWNDLAARPPARSAALVTDVGNDIMYGAPVRLIRDWLDLCLRRLRENTDSLAVTQLPLDSLATLGPRRFAFMSRILFPRTPLTYKAALERAEQVNESLIELAATYNASVVQPRGTWYGFDPIHIKLRSWSDAWHEMLAPCSGRREATPVNGSLRRWISLRRLRPQQRRLLGVTQHQQQPARRFADGSTLSLY